MLRKATLLGAAVLGNEFNSPEGGDPTDLVDSSFAAAHDLTSHLCAPTLTVSYD